MRFCTNKHTPLNTCYTYLETMKLSWKYYGHKTLDFVEHLLTLTSGAASAFEKRHLFIVSSCSRPKKMSDVI